MKTYSYLVTYIGYVEVPDDMTHEELRRLIVKQTIADEPNDVEYEEVK